VKGRALARRVLACEVDRARVAISARTAVNFVDDPRVARHARVLVVVLARAVTRAAPQ
jgi:hypothetical protein